MLRRSTSRSGSSLSRSKSTASMRSAVLDLEHISPADAIRDAHVAATVSFARARNRTRPSTVSHPRHTFSGNVQVRDGSGTELHHRRSVRFVRPVVASRGSASSRASETRGQTARTALPLNDLPSHAENRLLSRAPPLYNAPGAQGREDAYFRALRASDDCCTPEDNICSAPSSYRRLRKSKSLFTPSTASLVDRRSDCRFPSHQGFRAYTLRNDISSGKENQRPLRDSYHLSTPKSMSFLRSRPDIPVRKFIQHENDAAVEMARDMFRKTAQQQERLNSYPSRFFRSKSKLSQMSSEARRSMRSCSSSTNTNRFSLGNSTLSTRSSVRSKVRIASSSLKTKLKRLLHINNKDGSESLLTDSTGGVDRSASVSASHNQEPEHHTSHDDSQTKKSADYLISNVSSRLPSFREVPGSLKSRQCSLESMNSDNRSSTSGRRSSSWSNPGFETTPGVDARDWDNHRLSVIKEHGNHLSPPDHRNTLPSANGALYPRGNSGNAGLGLLAPKPAISGERLYSALMRHQREKGSLPDEGPIREDSPLTVNTDDSARLESRSPLTIRFVKPEDDVFVDRVSLSPPPESRHSTLIGSRSSSTGSIVRKPVPPPSNPQATPGPGPPVLASPHNHLFRTGSPYRRSLQEVMKGTNGAGAETPGVNYMLSTSDVHLPARCPSTQGSTGVRYSSSVYSSSTEFPEEPLLNTASKGATPSRYSSLGSIAMIPKDVPHWSQSAELKPPEVGSSEWKTWLASKIAKLEDPGRARSPAWPTSPGHVRQGAEVDSSDTASPACSPNELTKGSVPQIICVPVDRKGISARSLDTSENTPPTYEIRDGKNLSTEDPTSLAPPIPTRSNLRSAPSLPCVRTPSNHVKDRQPRAIPRPKSYLDLPGPGLKRRPGIRLARKERRLRPSSTVSCLNSAAREAGGGNRMSISMPNSPDIGREGKATSVVGSKEMVEMFLSSRKGRIAGEGEAFG